MGSPEGQLNVPSGQPNDDCPVLTGGCRTVLSKDPVTTIYDYAADPALSSVMFSNSLDGAAARGGSLLREHMVRGCHEPAPFPLAGWWQGCSGRWLLRWNHQVNMVVVNS